MLNLKKNKKWWCIFVGCLFLFITAVNVVLFFHTQSQAERMQLELAENKKQKFLMYWYRFFFSEYAAHIRLLQYGTPTADINQLIATHSHEFIPISEVMNGVVCPAQGNGPFDEDYIYFGARMMPLQGDDGFRFYAMSYMGDAVAVHNNQSFDALLDTKMLSNKRLDLTESFGLIDNWLSNHDYSDFWFEKPEDYGTSALMSYNSDDIDQDGKADFILDQAWVLSSKDYLPIEGAPRRAVFIDDYVYALENKEIHAFTWNKETKKTELIGAYPIKNMPHENLPYVILPLTKSLLGIRTQDKLDIYRIEQDGISYFASISGLSSGEVQVGGNGDFTGDNIDDFWLSQVATPTPYPNKNDHIFLINPLDIQPGDNYIDELFWMKILGSANYSDYDGIGTSLSLTAGDIDGDQRPDFSFTGHRHMNEAGALYILLGRFVEKGKTIDITHPEIIKILGRPMSQLAPPFHHWDATELTGDNHDDIIVTADNDLCSGLNAGAIYVLSGQKIFNEWQRKHTNNAD